MSSVLISGGSGLVGHRLTELLSARGYSVSWLSRSSTTQTSIPINTYKWNVEEQTIDPKSISEVDYIINLAGAGIADKRWTESRKKVILESRTNSVNLLRKTLAVTPNNVKAFISASAIGYYGERGDQSMNENDTPANDFLGNCCVEWERAVDEIDKLNIRTVKVRTGVVLSLEGGALPKMAQPIKLGLGAALGNGHQWMSWIHIDDLCNIYIKAIEDEQFSGAYNAVAPLPVTNAQLTKTLASVVHKPLWLPNPPAFILKLALGEMSSVILSSTKVSAEKLKNEGFQFQFPTIDIALKQLYS
ncbi:TIGR01777 family oxidoreductase [Solitalea koreensis]|uniref:TIGR01777 family protein n=1 Tax=Solitalea koreensis TaxID=543615 RepID=A0A521AM70_9SPHI|nr:TIGR01777 family oxidoreductase [Solitalea koreensis]SMO35750.1 hypothetical protein SAMN06265350_101244 [Solitalea koreensis]